MILRANWDLSELRASAPGPKRFRKWYREIVLDTNRVLWHVHVRYIEMTSWPWNWRIQEGSRLRYRDNNVEIMSQSVCIVSFDGPNQPTENTYLVTLFLLPGFCSKFQWCVCQCFRGPRFCLSTKTQKYTSVFKILYCESVFENLLFVRSSFWSGPKEEEEKEWNGDLML